MAVKDSKPAFKTMLDGGGKVGVFAGPRDVEVAGVNRVTNPQRCPGINVPRQDVDTRDCCESGTAVASEIKVSGSADVLSRYEVVSAESPAARVEGYVPSVHLTVLGKISLSKEVAP